MAVKKIYSSLALKYSERMLYHGIAFIIQIVLARILDPSDYGLLSIMTVFIAISQVFVQNGFNAALVQNKDVNTDDYSSVFWVSMLIAVVVYLILFFLAPFVSLFYNMPELKNVLRILALILIPGAYTSIQIAIITRKMDFKPLVYSTTVSIIFSGTLGIILAKHGFGVWSLVAQQLSNGIILCTALSIFARWKISFSISSSRIKVLFSFGWKLLCANLVDRVYNELQSLVIGKKYTSADLGFFNRGRQFPQLVVDNINGSIQTVMLPVFSRAQDDSIRLKAIMRRSIVVSSYFIFPMMVGLCIVAEPLVKVLLTEKWLLCVPYVRIFSITYAFYPIHTANLQAINAQGRSDYFLKLEVLKKTIGIIMLLVAIAFFDSPFAIAVGVAIVSVIACFINAYPNRKLLYYTYVEQMKDIFPMLVQSIAMGAIIFYIKYLGLSSLLLVIVQVVCGCGVYWVLSVLFKIEPYWYLVNQLKKIPWRRHKLSSSDIHDEGGY